MNQLLARLRARPRTYAELLVATLVINLMAFADTIFVMIVLRRYVAYGFDSTLLVLTAGTLAALGVQYGLTRVRLGLARCVGLREDRELSEQVFAALARARTLDLAGLPPGRPAEAAADLDTVRAGCAPQTLVSVLDAPFALLFILALLALSPALALLAAAGMGLALWTGQAAHRLSAPVDKDLAEARSEVRALAASASYGADTVRAFLAGGFYRGLWQGRSVRLVRLRQQVTDLKGVSHSLSGSVGVLVRVATYALGARMVVDGSLTFAALIGASMLGGYAMGRASSLVSARALWAEAAAARERLEDILSLPPEARDGQRPQGYAGGLALRGLEFSFPEAAAPLFTGLDLDLPPGGILVVQGPNGSGKTTLMRILAGLLAPTRGRVEAGGLDLAEWDPDFWRLQLTYMPQEPYFLAGTIRENLAMGRPGVEAARLGVVTGACGLRRFLDQSEKGLDAPLADFGRDLSLGVRRRLSLARALVVDGPLALLDEPTEGLDAEGKDAVYAVLNDLARAGRTIVAVSHDPGVAKAAHLALRLVPGQAPRLEQVRPFPAGEEQP